MFVNNRFVKFKFEKPNDNLKINENKINVLFYSEANILLSDGFSNGQSLTKFLSKNIESNSENFCLVRSEMGTYLLVKRKNQNNELTHKYLENIGGDIFKKLSLLDVLK